MIIHTNKSRFLPLTNFRLHGAKLFLILLAGVLISITSCNQPSIIGLDVQPKNDLLNVAYWDTTTLVTKTIRVDSLRTDEDLIYSGDALIGKYIDPVFGNTTASLYTQLRLITNNPLFGTSPTIDSVVLSLVYDPTYYGKINRVPQKVTVRQVSQDILIANSYFSNNTLTTNVSDLANYNFTPQPAQSVTILNELLEPQLRIPLDPSFGAAILNPINAPNLASNDAFHLFMKGLYITTENTTTLNSTEGNILHFKMGDAQSKVTLYYHNATDDSLRYDLGLTSVARFSHFAHDYSSGIDLNLASQLSITPPQQNDVAFIQGLAGVKTKIEMPYLMNWVKSGPVSINKAELVIKVDITSTYQLDTFAAPLQLILFGVNDDGTEYLIPDYAEGANYFGGVYNSTTHEYRFNIARYIQQVLMGKRNNNGLHIVAPSGALNANRVIIGGGGITSNYQMKLNIAYTKLH
jgi:hypothetical protein